MSQFVTNSQHDRNKEELFSTAGCRSVATGTLTVGTSVRLLSRSSDVRGQVSEYED